MKTKTQIQAWSPGLGTRLAVRKGLLQRIVLNCAKLRLLAPNCAGLTGGGGRTGQFDEVMLFV